MSRHGFRPLSWGVREGEEQVRRTGALPQAAVQVQWHARVRDDDERGREGEKLLDLRCPAALASSCMDRQQKSGSQVVFHSSRPPKVRGAPFDPVCVLTTSVNLWNKYCKAELKNKETGTPRRARLAAKASERAATNE